MDYTEGTEENKRKRAKKMMLWFGIISLSMSFAAFTSAYVVSRERPDWLADFEMPQAFWISLIVIVLSSLSMEIAKRSIQKGSKQLGTVFLLTTFILGCVFISLQFQGFAQIIESYGYNFTGATSNPKTTFIYLIAVVHIAHVVAALIALLVVLVKHLRNGYSQGNTLGVELCTTFWHFVDILWIYLFLFFYFVR